MFDPKKPRSPILLRGDAVTAYRDPAVYWDNGKFYLFFTLVETEPDGEVYMYLAETVSPDLCHFSHIRKLSPRDKRLNFSSPGCIVRHEGRYVICFQSYCRENGEKFGNKRCRIFLRRSDDLIHWDEPEQILPYGTDVPDDKMERMIDPYFLAAPDGKWWCFFKQDGISCSLSRDLRNWEYQGHWNGGENVCALYDHEKLMLWHSPANGIGLMTGPDPAHLQPEPGVITLGQKEWPWARGRLTAGFVLDLRNDPEVGCALLFFHGSGPEDERTFFDNYASIGFAWGTDMLNWKYISDKNLQSSIKTFETKPVCGM